MAGTLLHITLADRALNATSIPSHWEDEIQENIHDYRLGAVLVDLPYHERIWLNGLRLLFGLGLQCNVWGTLLHTRSPANLARALLDRAETPAKRALALGFLTHLAVDIVFHTEIHRLIMNKADGTKSLNAEHKQIEDQIDLHIHYNILEHSGIGTPYARRMFALHPTGSWTTHVSAAIAEIHGNAPEIAKLKQWQKELALYGLLCSSHRVPWVATLPEDNPKLQETALDLAEESVRLAAEYIETGIEYLNDHIDRQGFQNAVPDRSLLDGGCASPPRREIQEHR